MQTKNLEGVNRSNYIPAANERHLVHYKAEILRYDNKTGMKQSHASLVKTGVKMFPTVKRDLEKQGYTIEIVYHPQGKYNTPVQSAPVDNRDAEIAALKAELAKKDEEMKALADQAQEAAATEPEKPADEPTDTEAEPEKKAEPAKKQPKAAAKTAKK